MRDQTVILGLNSWIHELHPAPLAGGNFPEASRACVPQAW
jgi:hypothetical protein